jgi:VCBS repeat-containing protein
MIMRNLKYTQVCLLIGMLAVSGCGSDNDNKLAPIVNVAPTASDSAVTTQTEVTVNDMLNAKDGDGDVLTYSRVSAPTLGNVVINTDGSYTYTPSKEQIGTDSFVFAVSDGVNPEVTATVTITIEALQVDFAQFATDAFNQPANAEPLSVNGRIFTNTDTDVGGLLPVTGN